MKRNLFSWLLSVVFSLVFMASVSHADVLAIRCILGLSDEMVSAQTPVAQFAVDRPYDTPRPFSTDEIVGNSANDSFVLLPPASNQGLEAVPPSGELTMLLVVIAGGDLSQSNIGTGIVPAEFLRTVNGLANYRGATTIVLEVRVPTGGLPPQIPQQISTIGGLQSTSPEPASFQGSRESVQDYAGHIEISRARGPVK